MALRCPRCGSGVNAGSLEGTVPCPHCGTVLYAEEGRGVPHRIVSSCRSEAEILKAATDALLRAGLPGKAGAVTLYYVPYFVLEGEQGDRAWNGRAAVRLPVPALGEIPILGSDTRVYDPAVAPAGARVLPPTLRSAEVCAGRRILELRHVPMAHVSHDPESAGGSLWIEAERLRLLAGTPRLGREDRAGQGQLLSWWLGAVAASAAATALILPAPWSLLALAPILFAFHRGGLSRFLSAPGGIAR